MKISSQTNGSATALVMPLSFAASRTIASRGSICNRTEHAVLQSFKQPGVRLNEACVQSPLTALQKAWRAQLHMSTKELSAALEAAEVQGDGSFKVALDACAAARCAAPPPIHVVRPSDRPPTCPFWTILGHKGDGN